MVRALVCGVQMLLALAFTFPGCGKTERLHAPLQEPDGIPVGQLAPEIDGEDIDGVPFKLSDYRGKVVVLDFWGNW